MRRTVAMTALLALCAACGGSSAGTSSAPPSVTASPSAQAPVSVELPGQPYGLEAAGNALWVETDMEGSPALQRIDPVALKATVTLPGASIPLTVGPDLWYVLGKEIVRADPVTGAVREHVRTPGVGRFAIGPDDIWVVTGTEEQGTLLRVDRRHGRVSSRVPLPAGEAKDVLLAAGSVWVPVDGADVLVQVNAATGRLTRRIPVGSRPHSLAAGFGSVWLTNHGEPSARRIDAATGRVVATVADVGQNVAIAVTSSAVWVATPDGMARVDPQTNRVVERIAMPGTELYDAAVAGGSVWVTSVADARVYRVAAA